MEITFSEHAWQEYLNWQQQDPKYLKRINELIKDILRSPFSGIGKPEPLRFNLQGCWSRRIDSKHRLVYKIEGKKILIIKCSEHYSD